jgi:hypothetical protein
MDDAQFAAALVTAWASVIGLVITGLRLIMSGGLVPRSQVDAMTRVQEARLKESLDREQDWKATAGALNATVAEYADQFGQLLITARATEALVKALPTGRDT